MPSYYLGVDVGGTKTHALITDERGRVVGTGLAGAGNYEVVGWEGLETALNDVARAVLSSAGITIADLAGAGFGIAGYDWPGERQPHLDALATLSLAAPTALVNDCVIGLIAGATTGWGLGLVAGTGANCWGRDAHGRLGHTTGGAAMLGEYGGADTLVPEAVRAVSRAFTRRGPETMLTEAFIAHAGAKGAEDLLEGIFMGRYRIDTDAAPLIFRAAEAGDATAQDLVAWSGRELGDLAVGVIRQLGMEDVAFEVVQIGSLYKGSPVLSDVVLQTIRAVAPGARLTRLTVPPVAGAVMLAMEQAGVDVRRRRETIIAQAEAL